MAFGLQTRQQQATFRKTLSPAADNPTDPKGQKHGHLLALNCETENLMPCLRGKGGAQDIFAARNIHWWRSARSGDQSGNGPTRNLASSQINCVNFLLPLAGDPGALAELLRAVDSDVIRVLPIEHSVKPFSPVEFEWVGWNTPLEGGTITRGANQTSTDAFMLAETTAGLRAYVIEWKYCEEYLYPMDKGKGKSGATRRKRYTSLFSAPSSSFKPSAKLDDLFYEPFYQIMRLLLQADRMRQQGATKTQMVTDARVLVVCPKGNKEYRNVVKSTPLGKRFPSLKTVEEAVQANLKKPYVFKVIAQEFLVAALRSSNFAAKFQFWLDYHNLRYEW